MSTIRTGTIPEDMNLYKNRKYFKRRYELAWELKQFQKSLLTCIRTETIPEVMNLYKTDAIP